MPDDLGNFLEGEFTRRQFLLIAGTGLAMCKAASPVAILQLENYDIELIDTRRLTGGLHDPPSINCRYPIWHPDGTRILYSDRDLIVIDPNGCYIQNLGQHFAKSPAWSPDGKKIAFSASIEDSLSQNSIYVMDADGSNRKRLTQNNSADYIDDLDPAWSPDGKEILFSRCIWAGDSYIMRMNSDGSSQRPFISQNGHRFEHARWSLDGKKIVLASTLSDEQELEFREYLQRVNEADIRLYNLFLADPNGSILERISYGGPWSSFFQPSWSPDGKKVVCCYGKYVTKGDNGHLTTIKRKRSNICVIDVNTKKITVLTKPKEYHYSGNSGLFKLAYMLDTHPSWSPDGKKIAYSTGEPAAQYEGYSRMHRPLEGRPDEPYNSDVYVMNLRLVKRK